MAERGDDHTVDHAKTLSWGPGAYRHFIDERFRLKLAGVGGGAMAERADDHPVDPGKSLSWVRGTYRHFIDELLRLKLVDLEQRDYLAQGLRHAAAKGELAERAVVPPSSTHLVSGDGLERRALKSGL